MKLESLRVQNYRSLREVDLPLQSLNILIGTNASGKSNILDALRFLAQGIQEKDFEQAVRMRGRVVQLAWKGAKADFVSLETKFSNDHHRFKWSVRAERQDLEDSFEERLFSFAHENSAPTQLLESGSGTGWWWSQVNRQVKLSPPASNWVRPRSGLSRSVLPRPASRGVCGQVGVLRSESCFSATSNVSRR
jgi:predicted ATPase